MKYTDDGFNRESLVMKEMMLCMIEQDLNEFPWVITIIEYLKLYKIRNKK